MSSRIEDIDPLSLLCELPDAWAQACIARPSRRVLVWAGAILNETRRVLRDDGTLWLLLDRRETLPSYLAEQGWIAQPTPRWAAPLTLHASQQRLYLLSKTPRFFYDPHPLLRTPCTAGFGLGPRRGGACPEDASGTAALVRRCVLAGSSRVACGACGAPYRRTRDQHTAARRATCAHNNPGGRSLVIDPFTTADGVSVREVQAAGRHFLGVRGLREQLR